MAVVKITPLRRTCYPDLSERYENPLEKPCEMELGKIYFSHGERPEDFCGNAWETLSPFVQGLLRGERDYYDGWMKDPRSVFLSCNDGFRPVSFLVELVEE